MTHPNPPPCNASREVLLDIYYTTFANMLQYKRIVKSFEKEVWRKNFFKSFPSINPFLFQKSFTKKAFLQEMRKLF